MQQILADLVTAMQGITASLSTLSGVKANLETYNATLAAELRNLAATLTKLADDLDPPPAP